MWTCSIFSWKLSAVHHSSRNTVVSLEWHAYVMLRIGYSKTEPTVWSENVAIGREYKLQCIVKWDVCFLVMIGRLPSLSGRSVDGGQALEDAPLVVFDAVNVAIGREYNLQCGGLKMWQSITKSRKNTMLQALICSTYCTWNIYRSVLPCCIYLSYIAETPCVFILIYMLLYFALVYVWPGSSSSTVLMQSSVMTSLHQLDAASCWSEYHFWTAWYSWATLAMVWPLSVESVSAGHYTLF